MTNKDAKEYLIAHCYPDYPDEGKAMWDRVMHKAITALGLCEQTESDWIPCSKKKPKIGVDVLIRFERNCAVGFYSNGSWNINSGNGYYTGLVSSEDQPIAWKPLPEPWEGEQE